MINKNNLYNVKRKNNNNNSNGGGIINTASTLKDYQLFLLMISLFLVINIIYYLYYEREGGFVTTKRVYVPAGYEQDDAFRFANLDEKDEAKDKENKKIRAALETQRKKRMKTPKPKLQPFADGHPPIIIITSNKPYHLDRLLDNLINDAHANPAMIHVFNDGSMEIEGVLTRHRVPNIALYDPYPSAFDGAKHADKGLSPSDKIMFQTLHYKKIFRVVFENYRHAVFLEDDLLVSPDFIMYMKRLAGLFDEDPSVFCVSTWNDNAFKWASYPPDAPDHQPINLFNLKRQQHFGGLGWMTSNSTYRTKILPNWDDDTLPWDVIVQRSLLPDDECIFPEIPRTYHAPNLNRNYQLIKKDNEIDEWSYMQFSTFQIDWEDWSKQDIAYLLQPHYMGKMQEEIERSVFVESIEMITLLDNSARNGVHSYSYLVHADSNQDPRWDTALIRLGLVGCGNGGAVRGIHRGIVQLVWMGRPLYLVGLYSPYYYSDLVTQNSAALNEFAKSSLLDVDKSVTTLRSKANIFKLKNDQQVRIHPANEVQSCTQACNTINRFCHESDLLLLNDEKTALYMFESLCDNVVVDQQPSAQLSGDLPLRYDNYTCVVSSTPRYTSCNFHKLSNSPSIRTNRLCVCRSYPPKQPQQS